MSRDKIVNRRTVETRLITDITDDGMILEIDSSDEHTPTAEITLSDKQVDLLVWELVAPMGWRRLAKWIKTFEAMVAQSKADEKADRGE